MIYGEDIIKGTKLWEEVKGKVIKRTLQESTEYYINLGLTKEEYFSCLEEVYFTDAENIKYIFTIDGENVEGHAEGIQYVDGTFTYSLETRGRFIPESVSYDEMIEILIHNCKVY